MGDYVETSGDDANSAEMEKRYEGVEDHQDRLLSNLVRGDLMKTSEAYGQTPLARSKKLAV